MIINKKKKKKGFTLIELIAVIAILAILGAILVPKIGGYTQKATNAKVQADAKIVLTGISAYNAENTGTQITALNTTNVALISTYSTVPDYLATLTVSQLEIIASGTGFTATKSGNSYNISFPVPPS